MAKCRVPSNRRLRFDSWRLRTGFRISGFGLANRGDEAHFLTFFPDKTTFRHFRYEPEHP
jgi:hypothetical protein